MTDRGVSDVLGYVLVFSLVVSTIGMVYTTGLGGLDDVRESEKLSNAERAFDVLDSNVEDLVGGTAQTRATEIKLEGATLDFEDRVIVNVSNGNGRYYRAEMHPIYFAGDSDDARVVYENGAILREDGDSAVVRNEPDISFGEKTVVPLVVTRTRDTGRSGSGTVLVRTEVADRSVVRLPVEGGDANITITSPRAKAWADHLSESSETDCTVADGTATCSVDTDVVYVQVVRIDVTVE
ncbi:MAG: DUF7289 family protein [archaeon]